MKACFTLAFFFLAAVGCHSYALSPQSLVGEWRYADPVQSCRYEFERDGTFRGEVVLSGQRISAFRGQWSIEGDTLVYRYEVDTLGRIPPGSVDRDKLLRVGRNFLLIRAADGSQRKYLRVRRSSRGMNSK